MRRVRFVFTYILVLALSLPAAAASSPGCSGMSGGIPAATDAGNGHTAAVDPHAMHRRAAESGEVPASDDLQCDCCGAVCGMNTCHSVSAVHASALACMGAFVASDNSPLLAHPGEIPPALFRPPIA